jgi:acetylornithine deacetylase
MNSTSFLAPHPDRVIRLLESLVRFPSLSTEEKELVDWLEAEVRASGKLQVERYGDNLVFQLGQGSPRLLLNSHSDVVPPSSDHHGNPFEPYRDQERIYGRGTTDAKGCGSAMLTAMLEIAEEGGLKQGAVQFALTVCEEMAGYNNGMQFLRGILPKPDAAIVGEPTSLQPCVAQKGMIILKIIVHGTSGHAARVSENNAIYKMAEVIRKVETIRFEIENPFLGKVKITPTIVNGGIVKNMAPDRCELTIDIRTIPEVPNSIIINTFRDHLDAEVEVISERFVSTSTDPESAIAQAAIKAGQGPFFGSPTASDWVFLADVPTIKIGPGHSQQSHTCDESIEIDQLRKGVHLYKDIIRHYLEGS